MQIIRPAPAKTIPRKPPAKRKRTVSRIVFAIFAIFIGLNILMNIFYFGRALPHEYLGRLDIGGKKLSSLQNTSSSDILPGQITFTHEATKLSQTPAELGISADTAASLKTIDVHWHPLPVLSFFGTHHEAVVLKVSQGQFTSAAKKLAPTFFSPALGRHIGLNGTTFAVKAAQAGYQMDEPKLLNNTLAGLRRGSAMVAVPTTTIAAPKDSGAGLAAQVASLQKKLDTPIGFTYKNKTIHTTKADRSRWFIAHGNTMVLSPGDAETYIAGLGKTLKITVANPNDLALAAAYAEGKSDARSLMVVPASGGTVTRTYCTAVKDVDADVLGDLDGKLAMTYNDARGWNNNGRIAFEHTTNGCQYTVWMSAAKDMATFSSICDDYYNCQVGTSVVLNYDRWTTATPPWNKTGGSIQGYRTLMINHETGHRLGFLDNPTCPAAGQPAPVMMQQSVNLHGCTFNIWPRPAEFAQLDRMLNLSQTSSVTNLR